MSEISQACDKIRESLIEKTYSDNGDGGIRAFFWSVIRSKECEYLSDMRDPDTEFILVDNPFDVVCEIANRRDWSKIIDQTIKEMAFIRQIMLGDVYTPRPSDQSIALLLSQIFDSRVKGELRRLGMNTAKGIKLSEANIALDLIRWRIRSSIQSGMPECIQSLNDGRRYIGDLRKFLINEFDSDMELLGDNLKTMSEYLHITAIDSHRVPKTIGFPAWYCPATYYGIWYAEQLEGYNRHTCKEFSVARICESIDKKTVARDAEFPSGYQKHCLYNFANDWLKGNAILPSRAPSNREQLNMRLFKQERCFSPNSGQVPKQGSHHSGRHK